jgi:hypothetical protein
LRVSVFDLMLTLMGRRTVDDEVLPSIKLMIVPWNEA